MPARSDRKVMAEYFRNIADAIERGDEQAISDGKKMIAVFHLMRAVNATLRGSANAPQLASKAVLKASGRALP